MKALDSVINQTYKNYELIVIDDASTDNSPKVIEKYRKRFSKRIKVLTMKRNLNRGGDACANEGLKIAKGKFVARMDADDVAHPKRLEKQVKFLIENPTIFLVGSNAYVINDKGKIIGDKKEPLTSKDIYDAYFTLHPIIHPSAMFRKKINGKKFFYQIKFGANNDYYTFFKLLCKGVRYTNLKERLLYYRIHEKNDTFINIKKKFMNTLRTRIEMFLKYHYDPTFKQVATTLLQSLILFILPEKLIKELYLISKGIVKPESLLKRFAFKKNR